MKFNFSSLLAKTAIVFMVASVTACVTGHSQSSSVKPVVFPTPKYSWIPEGAYVNMENLRKVNLGLAKQQVYALIDKPHFEEGFFNVTEWNYIFKLEKTKNNWLTCQFQLRFDDERRVSQLSWKREDCKNIVEQPAK
ncbi:outer membrane protein assembly factor BamE [Methylophilus medardicus]|nr:outer membrane protein assembly factor BamE [Methylophilus medardicus]